MSSSIKKFTICNTSVLTEDNKESYTSKYCDTVMPPFQLSVCYGWMKKREKNVLKTSLFSEKERRHRRPARPVSPGYSTDSNYGSIDVVHRPYPKSDRKKQLIEQGKN